MIGPNQFQAEAKPPQGRPLKDLEMPHLAQRLVSTTKGHEKLTQKSITPNHGNSTYTPT